MKHFKNPVIRRVEFSLRSILDRLPYLKILLNRIRLQFWKLAYMHRDEKHFRHAKLRTIYIDPSKIKYCIIGPYDKRHDKGKIMDGDWDKEERPFEGLDVFQSFQDHFIKGIEWSGTQWYYRVLNQIDNGVFKWGCKSKVDFDKKCCEFDTFFEEIKSSGYKSQAEIPDKENTPYEIYDEVSVSIGRHGQLLFTDGRHRLSIAKLLNIKKIPMQITRRHKQWNDFSNEILTYVNRNGGKVYAPLLHPDLVDIPSHHSHERFEIMKSNLMIRNGDLLDIGSHWGYFCHKFEDQGFNCFAVETNPLNLYFMEKLKKAEDKKFKIINKSIFDYEDKTDFDIVIALNIFHHFLKDKARYHQLIKLLKRLKMRVLFFSPHRFNESQMQESYVNYNPDEFVDFILSNSNLNKRKLIGETDDQRKLFMLY